MKNKKNLTENGGEFNGYASLKEWNEELKGNAQVELFKWYQEESKKLETVEFV